MQVKTFRAPTMEKALAMVKKELGPDAIILSSKKSVSGSGDSIFDVSAAREQQPARPRPRQFQQMGRYRLNFEMIFRR